MPRGGPTALTEDTLIELSLRIPDDGIDAGRGLLLRPPRGEDSSALIETCDDPDVVRWTGIPSDYETREAAAFIAGPARGIAGGTSVNLLGFEGGRLVGSFGYPRISSEDARASSGTGSPRRHAAAASLPG